MSPAGGDSMRQTKFGGFTNSSRVVIGTPQHVFTGLNLGKQSFNLKELGAPSPYLVKQAASARKVVEGKVRLMSK